MQDTYTTLTTTTTTTTTSANSGTQANSTADEARADVNPTTPTPAALLTTTPSTSGAAVDPKNASASTAKAATTAETASASAGKLITTEDREVGDVSSAVYATWATAAGGLLVGVYILIYFSAGESTSVLSSYWLSLWSQHTSRGMIVVTNVFYC